MFYLNFIYNIFIIYIIRYRVFNGLLSHQEDKQKCEIIHNRDKNAVQNMLNIVKNIFTIGKSPDIFTRIHT